VPQILKAMFYNLKEKLHDAAKQGGDQTFNPLSMLNMGAQDGHTVPITPTAHCGHCGTRKAKGKRCSSCNFPLRRQVDYAELTDWLMYSYLAVVAFRLDTNNDGEYVSIFQGLIRLLPIARCYQSPDALGHDFFRHQCYFATHVVLLFSDYGQHAVVRCLCTTEWDFIVKYMDFAVDHLEVRRCLLLPLVTSVQLISSFSCSASTTT
jgi:hypothetical protein